MTRAGPQPAADLTATFYGGGHRDHERHQMNTQPLSGSLSGAPLHAGMTLGADLDLTLIDTRDATALALKHVNNTCGESIDIEEFLSRLGLPIRDELAHWITPERIPEAVKVFRAAFLDEGLSRLRPLPGAADVAAGLQAGGGRLVVITSRIRPIARACLRAVNLPAAAVVGDVTGVQKAQPMVEQQIKIYVGDHVMDMQGATAAGIPGIGVSTGAHTKAQLLAAGATWVSDGLAQIAARLR
jgi:phosphoglycolate phosphatase